MKSKRAGSAVATALRRHPVLHTYRPTHAGKEVVAGWVRKAPGGKPYLLLQRGEEHFYIKRQALGADTSIFRHARDNFGIEDVIILYSGRRGKMTVYRSHWGVWERKAFTVAYEDFDEQLQLSVRAMEVWEADT